MIRQFNLKTHIFADPVIVTDEAGQPILTTPPASEIGQLQYTTSGDDWIALYNQSEIDAISSSITSGGAVWLEGGKLHTSGKPPSLYHYWNGKEWELSKERQQAVVSAEKSAKREEINRKRDEVCFGGIYIEKLGKWFDTDETSFVKMIGAKSVMDDDFANGQEVKPELWICADNSVVQLNRDDFALIIRSVKQNVSAMHALAVQHKMQLEQSEKPSEYDFSAGWSKTYAEYVNEQKS